MASYKKNIKLVRDHLQENESIISTIDGHFESNGWLRNGILVATEKRLIFFSDKLAGFDLESFPFTNISSYVLSKEMLGQKIKFFASGNEVTIKNITSENIKEFNNYINSNIGSQNNNKTEIHIESIASQLEKLATLLDKKLITEDEFFKMKSDISSNKSPNKVSIKNETTKQKTQDNQPLFDKRKTSSNKRLKIVLLIFVVIPIFIIVVSAVFNDYEIEKYDNHITKYTASNLNLRSTPKIANNIVKVLAPNNKLIIYDSIINDFIMVLDEDSTKIGWVSDQHLQMKPLNKKQLAVIKKKQEQKKVKSEPVTSVPKFKIITEDKNKALKKVTINVRLEKEISKADLKKIGLYIKENRPHYEKFWIFYFLPWHETDNGAWATTHFRPELEVKILGATKEDMDKMNGTPVSGTILNIWNDNNPITPNKIYLVKENENLFLKTIYAASGYSNATEIITKITVLNKNDQVRYNYKNKHGEYFVLENNGNLSLYSPDGKFSEAIKEK